MVNSNGSIMRSLIVFLLLATPVAAQPARSFEDVADVTTRFEPAQAKPGEVVTFHLTVLPKPGCWTYPTSTGKTKIKLPKMGDVVFDGIIQDPAGAKEVLDDGMAVLKYYEPVTWSLKGTVAASATPGKKKITLTGTKLQVCNDQNCFYTTGPTTPEAEIEILAGSGTPPPVQTDNKPPTRTQQQTPPVTTELPKPAAVAASGIIKKSPKSPEQHKAALDDLLAKLDKGDSKLPSTSMLGFLLTAAVWGYISLVTPCVFPMIPITVSLFLKQGNKSTKEVLKLAAVYSLTIILVLGLSAFFFLGIFRELSVNPWMNIALGVMLVAFALSLFGMFDITMPGFLLRYTESKRGTGGMIGTVFGALAFSIVSFTCVAPFLGGFAGFVASGNFSKLQLILGALTFATAFASPFFLLAMFPSLIKKMPKSGGWLDTIKAVMGFLEVAAALKFFRTAELRLLSPTEYFTYELCLAGLIIVSALCGLYLLNLFRLPHDEERPNIGVGRLMWAMLFLGLALYLLPGVFKTSEGKSQRPRGVVFAWVDAFLLPEGESTGGGLPWNSDLPDAIANARKSSQLVFVDFTGVTCQNCKYNEHNIFPKPEVDELLRRFVLAQMYTDEVPAEFYNAAVSDTDRSTEAAANETFQRLAFGDEKLPLYAILEPLPNGRVRVVDVYDEGKINAASRFAEFLKKPLAK
jgi:thiol:disulfide interchange protein